MFGVNTIMVGSIGTTYAVYKILKAHGMKEKATYIIGDFKYIYN
jgi:hypothetical protein